MQRISAPAQSSFARLPFFLKRSTAAAAAAGPEKENENADELCHRKPPEFHSGCNAVFLEEPVMQTNAFWFALLLHWVLLEGNFIVS